MTAPPAEVRRRARLVVAAGDELWATVRPLDLDVPWWPETASITERHPALTVVRLLSARPAPGHPMGGDATYLVVAEGGTAALEAELGLEPRPDRSVLEPHPLRMPWADPATARHAVEWAARQAEPTGRPVQHKTWNLSAVWALPTAGGRRWVVSRPPFLVDEAVVLEALAGPTVPPVLAAADHRLLLADLPGVDGHDATVAERCAIVDELIALQRRSVGEVERLVAAGLPDHRGHRLADGLIRLVDTRAPDDGPLGELVADLPRRLEAVAACGLPDVVVHGDAHPGNARIGAERPVLFDWADSFAGNPLLDLNRVIEGSTADDRAVRRHWLDRWAGAVPGSDPHRAASLLAPLLPLRDAWVYQRFLDHIEPDERIYHLADVPDRLAAASRVAAAGGGARAG